MRIDIQKFSVLFTIILASVAFAATVPIGPVLKVELAKYDPFPAEAGSIATIWIKAENIGTEPARSEAFTLSVDYPFSLPNNDPARSYGRISSGEDILLEYKLLVDANAPNGTYKMKIRYGSSPTVLEEKEFEITVNEQEKDADLKALFVEIEPAAYPGGTAKLTMDIINRNPGTAYFTVVSARSDVALIERNEVYVGNLESDDFDSVDFDLKIRGDAQPGEYPVHVTMQYKNKDSVPLEKNDTINIKIISANEAQQSTRGEPPITNIIILVIVLLIAARLVVPLYRWYFKPFRNRK
jgi:hypothetical protein